MTQSIKFLLGFYNCWSSILSLPTWILVGMTAIGIFGIGVLLPVFAVLIITWYLIAVYFETYSSLSESFDKTLEIGLSIYNTVGLVVLVYLILAYHGVLLEAMTPPIWK